MVQEAMSYLDKAANLEAKLELIHTLRAVTEGKVGLFSFSFCFFFKFIYYIFWILTYKIKQIFVEIERARLTRMLSKIREDEGKIKEACDILQQLQVIFLNFYFIFFFPFPFLFFFFFFFL